MEQGFKEVSEKLTRTEYHKARTQMHDSDTKTVFKNQSLFTWAKGSVHEKAVKHRQTKE